MNYSIIYYRYHVLGGTQSQLLGKPPVSSRGTAKREYLNGLLIIDSEIPKASLVG